MIETKERQKNWNYKISLINEKCDLQNFVYYHKGNVIQAPLEALLTFYLAESLILFTNHFYSEVLSDLTIFPLVFTPLIISLLTCIVYTVACIIKISHKLVDCLESIQEYIKNNKMKEAYMYTNDSFKRVFKTIHIWGTVLYTLVGFGFSIYIVKNIRLKMDNLLFIFLTTTFALFFGVFWNIAGYRGDQRIKWETIIKDLKIEDDVKKDIYYKIYQGKYESFKWQSSMHVVGVFIVLVIAVFIMVFLKRNIMVQNGSSSFEIYYIFITLFITSITLYIKYIFAHFYSWRSKESEIFINIKDFK